MRDLHMRQLPRDNQTVIAHKSPARGNDSLLSIGRQGNVAAAGMSAVEGPFSLSVADDEDAGSSHTGDVGIKRVREGHELFCTDGGVRGKRRE